VVNKTSWSAGMVLEGGVALLHPDEQVFQAMLQGWRRQQLARNLSFVTVESNQALVRRFQAFTNEYPWSWSPGHVDEWAEELRCVGRRSRSTVRGYQGMLRAFLAYVCDPAYGWAEECLSRFGTHPVQVCLPGNTASHVGGPEGSAVRRAFTRTELQALFDLADSDVCEARRLGRKGWLSLFRDATAFKVAYAWGLRRQELQMLDTADFASNPQAPEFGAYGACYVRHGKGSHGSGPRRRTVLTVMPWSVEVLKEWAEEVLPGLETGVNTAMWPSERSVRVGEHRLNARFAQLRSRLGLPDGLGMHGLRHAYVTHLIEDGWDCLFVQQQVGHEYSSTTAAYTSVSSDYRTRVVREALDRICRPARTEK